MAKVPMSVTKESYQLRSTFFYNRLNSEGYFTLFLQMQTYSKIEGANLNWDKKAEWGISDGAWEVVMKNDISPCLVFMHPKVLQLNPSVIKYYRSIAMIPQKGLKALTGLSNVDRLESGQIRAGELGSEQTFKYVTTINENMSLVVSLATEFTENKIEGMMYATAGAKIDGSWRNAIGSEGERVIRSIIIQELDRQSEISSIADRNGRLYGANEWERLYEKTDDIKILNIVNGYSILFSSEPDVTIYDNQGAITGVIEIKSGLDPAGALERLGAMLKSFENTLSEYPNAVTILVASCITDEVENRLGASMVVRQKYITTSITSSDTEKRKFVNRLRRIMNLVKQK